MKEFVSIKDNPPKRFEKIILAKYIESIQKWITHIGFYPNNKYTHWAKMPKFPKFPN